MLRHPLTRVKAGRYRARTARPRRRRGNQSPSGALISARFPMRRNVYRDDYRLVVDGTGLEQGGPASASPSGRIIAKAEYHHYGGILPFAILHRVWYTQLNNSEVGMEIYMRNYEIENEMYRRAVELIEARYPVGWGGAGVVHTSNGNYYTSVSIETANASAVLCIETGAMLEAHKFNEKVTHCMCLVRKDEKSPYQILSPCGICQERLRYWGEDVQVAVTTEEEKIKFVQLKELQPYHWTKAYPAEELEHWNE